MSPDFPTKDHSVRKNLPLLQVREGKKKSGGGGERGKKLQQTSVEANRGEKKTFRVFRGIFFGVGGEKVFSVPEVPDIKNQKGPKRERGKDKKGRKKKEAPRPSHTAVGRKPSTSKKKIPFPENMEKKRGKKKRRKGLNVMDLLIEAVGDLCVGEAERKSSRWSKRGGGTIRKEVQRTKTNTGGTLLPTGRGKRGRACREFHIKGLTGKGGPRGARTSGPQVGGRGRKKGWEKKKRP